MSFPHVIRKIDLLDQPTEAVIYSTNVQLRCSGGVGAALVDRYGPEVQHGLRLLLTGRRFCDQGEIFEWVPPGMKCRAVFHTVPTDTWHNTTPQIVEDVLRRTLARCGERGFTRVALSALATGYGDLLLKEFLVLADRVFCDPAYVFLKEAVLCLPDASAHALAVKIVESEKLHWRTDAKD
jgi:O-acetyl-ADP-ribose deacetylase (regulator of RNase III)